MTTVLQIDSSVYSNQGTSSTLARRLIDRLRAATPDLDVVHRDLGRQPLPHLDGARIQALMTPATERTPEQAAWVAQADAVIAEIQAADPLVIGAPMYNFSVPTQLKSWFDYVARAGVTFRYTASGPQGLLTGKKAYVITTRGGVHRAQPTDTVVPWITTMLNFVGITDVEFIYAEGLAMGEEPRSRSLAAAQASIDALRTPVAA